MVLWRMIAGVRIDNYWKLQYHPSMDEVRQKLAELQGKGWTLAAVADELGAHRETLYGWMARGHEPTHRKLVVLALDGLLRRRRIPKKRRYTEGSRRRA